MHGEVEAAAQFRERLQGLQSASCLGGEHALGRCQQIAERLAVGASHAPTHLVQVAESEAVGIVDDDGVGIRNIDAVLDNRRREQHIIIVVDEIHDDALQLLRLHLPMTNGHATIGHVLQDEPLDFLEVRDAVVDEEHLAVARHLVVDGIGDEVAAIGAKLRVDGIAVGWRCADDAHIAGSHERELQRARDGCCRHRQRVDVRLQLAQLFLHGDTELLFLVDDEQA